LGIFKIVPPNYIGGRRFAADPTCVQIKRLRRPIIGAILIYGVNDAFGKKAMYVAAPIIVIGLYLLLPPGE